MLNTLLASRVIIPWAFLFWAAFGSASPQLPTTVSKDQTIQTLEPGGQVEKEIASAETHVYEVALEPDRYVVFFSEHPGLRAELKLVDFRGKVISALDNVAISGWLRVQGVAVEAGRYRIEMRAFRSQTSPAPLRYRLSWREYRPPTDRERLKQRIEESRLRSLTHSRNGEYAEALSELENELVMQRAVVPGEPAEVVKILNRVGIAATRLGDFARAEGALNQAIELAGSRLSPEDELLANSLDALAHLYTVFGVNYSTALEHLQRALAIEEKALGTRHAVVANTLQLLGNLSFASSDYREAEKMYGRALDIFEAQTPGSQLSSTPLYSLGRISHLRGQYDEAETLFQRARLLQERVLGRDHATTALTIFALGKLAQDRGQLSEASDLYQRAYEIFARSRGADHVLTIEVLEALAQLKLSQGEMNAALHSQKQALAAAQRNLSVLLAIGSEEQRRSFLRLYQHQADVLLSLHLRRSIDDRSLEELVATTLLQRKGLVQETFANTLANLRSRLDPSTHGVVDQWQTVTTQLARLVLDGPAQRMTTAEYQQQVETLTQKRDQFENELSRRSAGSFRPAGAVTLSEIRAVIPAGAALLEFTVYRPFDPRKPTYGDRYGKPRYAVCLIRGSGELAWHELGEAATLESAINAWRAALREPRRNDTTRLGRVVSALLLAPLQSLLGGIDHLLISPDGLLDLIPFEALPEASGKYLVERYAITYLNSGRDLMRMKSGASLPLAGAPLVLADPLFGEPRVTAPGQDTLSMAGSASGSGRSQSESGDLRGVYFAPLIASAHEARAIKTLFADATVLTGARASEAALKEVRAPRLLHLATHGFFLADTAHRPTASVNPLLRSGLALAGANLRNEHASLEDGILTALEAAGLSLQGTRLVTLSACDTGLGEVRNGEGVFGLRRAFALAGAETLVMSLWPMSDMVTRELMTAFYTNLHRGFGRGPALRAVQLQMLKRPDRRAPYYWAGFIEAGQWTAF